MLLFGLRVNYHKISVETVSERLRAVLTSMSDVKIAVLFGSALTRNHVRDLDVGIFMNVEPDFKRVIEIVSALEDSIGVPVDVMPLNKAPPKLRFKALSKE
ncbi:MAG: nucleotidyltransferase domain-containing protein [Nitrososphaerales archaeon]